MVADDATVVRVTEAPSPEAVSEGGILRIPKEHRERIKRGVRLPPIYASEVVPRRTLGDLEARAIKELQKQQVVFANEVEGLGSPGPVHVPAGARALVVGRYAPYDEHTSDAPHDGGVFLISNEQSKMDGLPRLPIYKIGSPSIAWFANRVRQPQEDELVRLLHVGGSACYVELASYTFTSNFAFFDVYPTERHPKSWPSHAACAGNRNIDVLVKASIELATALQLPTVVWGSEKPVKKNEGYRMHEVALGIPGALQVRHPTYFLKARTSTKDDEVDRLDDAIAKLQVNFKRTISEAPCRRWLETLRLQHGVDATVEYEQTRSARQRGGKACKGHTRTNEQIEQCAARLLATIPELTRDSAVMFARMTDAKKLDYANKENLQHQMTAQKMTAGRKGGRAGLKFQEYGRLDNRTIERLSEKVDTVLQEQEFAAMRALLTREQIVNWIALNREAFRARCGTTSYTPDFVLLVGGTEKEHARRLGCNSYLRTVRCLITHFSDFILANKMTL